MNKINFQDIQAQHLNRYRLVKVDGTADEYDLTPVRGAVTQEGTPIRALELNQLQDNVDTALAEKLPAMPMDYTVSAGGANNNYAEVHAYTTYTNMLRTVNGTNISARNSLIPYASESCNLGTSAIKWNNVYASNVYQNGYRAWDLSTLPYETGEWTPKFTFALDSDTVSGTGGAKGQCVRIGKLVNCNFYIWVSSPFTAGSTSTSNWVYISDLPFTCTESVSVSIPYYTNANANSYLYLYGSIEANTKRFMLRGANNGGFQNYTRAMLAGKTDVRLSGSFCYQTA